MKAYEATNTTMLDETKRLWDVIKHKLTPEGLLDVIMYFPEFKEEASILAKAHEKEDDEEED